jgi:hypothetical protein
MSRFFLFFQSLIFASTVANLFDLFVAFDDLVDVPNKILVTADRNAVACKFCANLYRRQSLRLFSEDDFNRFGRPDSCGNQRFLTTCFRQRLETISNLFPRVKLVLDALFLALQLKDFLFGFGEMIAASH